MRIALERSRDILLPLAPRADASGWKGERDKREIERIAEKKRALLDAEHSWISAECDARGSPLARNLPRLARDLVPGIDSRPPTTTENGAVIFRAHVGSPEELDLATR